MVQILTLLIALQGQAIPTPSEDALTAQIQRIGPKWRRKRFRKTFAGWYAKRILIEAKRRNLDPLAMTAIAWTESHFRPWAKGVPGTRRAAEIGVWQIIPYSGPVARARRTLRGCKPPPRLSRRYRRIWLRRMNGNSCGDQAVANRRRKVGRFSVVELRDHLIGTYVAAHEMRQQIDGSIRRRIRPRRIRGCRLPRSTQLRLYRYGHYNSGPRRPMRYYVYRICRRYRILLRRTQAFDNRVKALATARGNR